MEEKNEYLINIDKLEIILNKTNIHLSDKEKYKRVSFVDIDLPRIKKETAVVGKYRAESKQEEITKLKEKPAPPAEGCAELFEATLLS